MQRLDKTASDQAAPEDIIGENTDGSPPTLARESRHIVGLMTLEYDITAIRPVHRALNSPALRRNSPQPEVNLTPAEE